MRNSSAHKQPQQLENMHSGGATSAPPPTPSTQPSGNNLLSTSDVAADTLSKLLNRLPPTLSLPTRRPPPAACPPSISFSDVQANPILLRDLLSSSSSHLGFFQLTNHSIPSQLADSAESEALSLFDLPRDQKESHFPKSWPLGFEDDEDDESFCLDDGVDGLGLGESFCLDASCSTELPLTSLREFTRALEKVGLKIVELLSSSVGFENPLRNNDPTRFSSMMWISEGFPGKKPPLAGRFYPYVIGLQYQIRSGQKYCLLADSGWVSVLPQVESVMVTIGDIAQVWSNGKLKKVRGSRAVRCLGDEDKYKSRCISMSVLVTLPVDSRVSPLVSIETINNDRDDDEEDDHRIINGGSGTNSEREGRVFKSFCFEDYAWRVYHERLLFKDPLDRYRFKNSI